MRSAHKPAANILDRMTTEVKYIVEHKKFKRTWDDYVTCWEFIIPIVTTLVGLILLYEGNEIEKSIIGTVLIVSSFPLMMFLLMRLRQINGFEELESKRTKEKNFQHCILRLKTLNIVEVDNDINNLTISAKYKSTLIPPVYEWLTIVCLDNKLLVNSRPTPATLLFWFRRNAIIAFIKSV